jgi:hypothetical protein
VQIRVVFFHHFAGVFDDEFDVLQLEVGVVVDSFDDFLLFSFVEAL